MASSKENTISMDSVNILIGCTGSVASIKLMPLIRELIALKRSKYLNLSLNIRVVATEHSLHFFNVEEVKHEVDVFLDRDEWETWKSMNDPVLHIELRRWAHTFVIAPLDANTMAKIVNGLCDNLLTSVVRAWDMTKPLLFCPAMNTHMWNHPITSSHVAAMKNLGYIEVPCISKKLACGDEGFGAMAEVTTIAKAVFCNLEEYFNKLT